MQEKVDEIVVGFGPRFFPGKYFSNGTTFAMIATTLATCDIPPGLDENGSEVLSTPPAQSCIFSSYFAEFRILTDFRFHKQIPGTKLRLRVRSAEATSLLSDISKKVDAYWK